MLVLTRMPGEVVNIWLRTEDGEELICQVIVARADARVSLGFRADPDIVIRRKELDDFRIGGAE